MTFRHTHRRTLVLVAACAATLALSGCDSARRALGYEKTAPDEFTVVSRAPLSMPPDYSLRPPQPGAARPQEGTRRDQARDVLIGRSGQTNIIDRAGRSGGEVSLLKQAGADRAQPDIRSTVNRETTALVEEEKSFTDRLIFWREPAQPGEIIDAKKESQRIRDNQALGKAVTDGDTPQIKRRQKGILEGIF